MEKKIREPKKAPASEKSPYGGPVPGFDKKIMTPTT